MPRELRGASARDVVLPMDDQEAHDVHHALSMAVQLIDFAQAEGGIPADAALQADSRARLIGVAQRLDHERRWKGAMPIGGHRG